MQIGIGKIVREHGIKGDVIIVPYNPDSDHFDLNVAVSIHHKILGECSAVLNNVRPYRDGFLVHFDFLKNPEDAKKWRGAEISIEKKEMKKPKKGEYYLQDLIGIHVVTLDGQDLGEIKKFDEGSANLLMVVGEKEVLIPWVQAWIKKIDLPGKKIMMDLPPGFDEL